MDILKYSYSSGSQIEFGNQSGDVQFDILHSDVKFARIGMLD